MKNKNLIIITLFFLTLFYSKAVAEEDFVFESDSIEIFNERNLVVAKNGVKIKTSNDLEIFSNTSKYYKEKKKLFLIGNVKIIDLKKNLIIESPEVEYDKILEKIETKYKTNVNIDGNYIISGSKIEYYKLKNVLKSDEKTILTDKSKNKIESNSFNYFINEKKFISKELVITDNNFNKYYSETAAVSLNNNEIAAKDIEVYFSKTGEFGENSRLKGNSMISNNNKSIIKKGIFTTCKQTDSCPPWSLKSDEIEHDKKKKIITYKKAWLNLYDKPVFYFPKFFHPDPTVKRQSGFLIPSVMNSSDSGNSFVIPYFHVIAGNKDFTITPRFFFNNDILLQNEYRQVNENLKHISDFSIKKLKSSTKNHIFTNTKISLNTFNFDVTTIEANIEKTSNDTYLKSDKVDNNISGNQSLLNSFVKLNSNREDLTVSAELAVYEDLTKEKNSDKFQYILPNINLSKTINTNFDLKGDLIYEISAANQKRNTNVNETYVINDLKYNSNSLISSFGFVNNFGLSYKNTSKEGKNSNNYNDDFESDNFITSFFSSSLPLEKFYKNSKSTLSPKILASFSPFKSENLSNLDRQINITNLFSNNRLGLTDSLEGGQSLTFGLDYELLNKDNDKYFESSFGQIFRDKNDPKLPLSSTMQNKSSNIFGQLKFTPNKNFEINYDFAADNNLDTINLNLIESKFQVNNLITTFEFLEENNEIGKDSYFSNDIKYKFR